MRLWRLSLMVSLLLLSSARSHASDALTPLDDAALAAIRGGDLLSETFDFVAELLAYTALQEGALPGRIHYEYEGEPSMQTYLTAQLDPSGAFALHLAVQARQDTTKSLRPQSETVFIDWGSAALLP